MIKFFNRKNKKNQDKQAAQESDKPIDEAQNQSAQNTESKVVDQPPSPESVAAGANQRTPPTAQQTTPVVPEQTEGTPAPSAEAVPVSQRITTEYRALDKGTEAIGHENTTAAPVDANPLEQKLNKTQANFGQKMKQLFSIKKKIDEDLFEELETTLLMADVGATATMEVLEKVRKSLKRKNLSDSDAVFSALKEQLTELALVVEQPLVIDDSKKPFVILVVGVNGVGKTTTIAKLARKYKGLGKQVMLAAGDTFRAAAVEQLKTWGAREDIPVMAQNTGADSASVIFDAMTSAKSKGMDVLIADTAGRLHTQANLMQELEKIVRVIRKNDPSAPHEALIVIDGGTGQNAISQVREFNKDNLLSGVVITKLDGTPKGGVLFNLAAEFKLPVRFIGVGEKSSDLKPYQAAEFVQAIID